MQNAMVVDVGRGAGAGVMMTEELMKNEDLGGKLKKREKEQKTKLHQKRGIGLLNVSIWAMSSKLFLRFAPQAESLYAGIIGMHKILYPC